MGFVVLITAYYKETSAIAQLKHIFSIRFLEKIRKDYPKMKTMGKKMAVLKHRKSWVELSLRGDV